MILKIFDILFQHHDKPYKQTITKPNLTALGNYRNQKFFCIFTT